MSVIEYRPNTYSRVSDLALIMIFAIIFSKTKASLNHMLDWLCVAELIRRGSSLFPIILCTGS